VEKDVEELKEILALVSEKIPALLNSLTDVLYGKEQASKYGEAVARFYKTLKETGMTDEQAFELTKQYMSSLNIPGMIGEALSGRGKKIGIRTKEDIDEDFGKEIEKIVKERIKKKFEKEE